VLQQASTGFEKGAFIVDHTTTSAAGAVRRAAYWKSKGFTYLHAPVFMNPQNALQSTGFMLVSGDQSVIAQLQPYLSGMTGKLLNFGPEEGKAAGIKLVGNAFLIALTGGLCDVLALAKAHHIAAQDVLQLFGDWNPGAMAPSRLQRIAEGNYDEPSWELNMARKDAALMIDAARETAAQLMVIPAVAALMDEWIERGEGNKDWTVIAKDHL
jgi:3-hydroxyisobutyrate dehydrogenase